MELRNTEKEWFVDWFNTPYYHILYKNRNYDEAEKFINNITAFLKPGQDDLILDLACGKGRHSIFLNKLGYNVVGVDLSTNSIEAAKASANDRLQFFTHDMRDVIPGYEFEYIFNLFTSFAYFDPEHNKKVLESIHANLKENGTVLIDFLNAKKAVKQMKSFEIKKIDDLDFIIHKKYEQGTIIKDIEFTDDREYHFQERVQALTLEDFEVLLADAGLTLLHTFGDYDLNSFDEEKSDRLILIAQKQK